MCVYPFITLVSCVVYFWCAGSVRISLAGRVIYFLCGTPLCGVPGRYNLFECFLEVDGRTVQVFFWFCCSEYGTVEMVGGWSGFLFIFFILLDLFGGRMSVVGFCVP